MPEQNTVGNDFSLSGLNFFVVDDLNTAGSAIAARLLESFEDTIDGTLTARTSS